jgi:hypothetical protein
MNDSHRTPNKQDTKLETELEDQKNPPSPEPNRRRLRLLKQDHETETMKKLFTSFTKKTQTQLCEQEEKHAMEITAMKRASMDTQNLLTTKTAPTQTRNDYRISAHFTAMTKPLEILFQGKPENWPEFEHHLLQEAENPTIGWNQELMNFQTMDKRTKPCSFLE